jgi:S1-C subfamily serine protease
MKRNTALLAACVLASGTAGGGQFGTGFAVSPKGYLVTCHHVVADASRIVVHVSGGYLEAEVVALDPRNDLAVLKVPSWPGRHLGLAPSSEISYASPVVAAGFPDPSVLGTNPKISTGIVNALSGVRDDPRHIQVSAPVQPGNSGGPLVSASGRAVGVVAAGLNSIDRMEHGGYLPQSVNYAIKGELVLALLKGASVSLPHFGTRVPPGPKQIERTLGAIALIESLGKGEKPYLASQPLALPKSPVSAALLPISSSRKAARGPWVFPDSHQRPLNIEEVEPLNREGLWRARNEIYLRHGYVFPHEEGRRFAAEFGGLYQPRTDSTEAVQARLSPVEVANLRLIADYERR